MPIKPSDRTLKSVVDSAENGEIVLPNFQRDYVWKVGDQKSLATSVLLGVPAGALLLIRGTLADYSYRFIGKRDAESAPAGKHPRSCEFLLDGQQRLSSLQMVFGDPLSSSAWPGPMDGRFGALNARFVLQIAPAADDTQDLFGLRSLSFDSLPPDPDLVGDLFQRFAIRKNSGFDQWYHPKFGHEKGLATRRLDCARGAAQAGCVPLWEVLSADIDKKSSALGLALQALAEKQRAELLALHRDSKLSADILNDLVIPGEDVADLDEESISERLLERKHQWVQDVYSFLVSARNFQFATIELDADEISKAIIIFGAINRGGTPLTPFDLVTAKYAALRSDASLPELIARRLDNFPSSVEKALFPSSGFEQWSPAPVVTVKDGSLSASFRKQFLQVLSIHKKSAVPPIPSLQVSDMKQEEVLRLTVDDIDANWQSSSDGLARAWQFLQLRCGVPSEGALRNNLLLLPLSVTLCDERVVRDFDTYNKVEFWYWASVLTATYTQRQNDQAVHDTEELLKWVLGEVTVNPFKSRAEKVLKDGGYSDRNTLLRIDSPSSVGSDVDEYLLQFVVSAGARDLIDDRKISVVGDELNDHHLIPLATATSIGQSSREIRKSKGNETASLLNSPLNRAYILQKTNAIIGPMALSKYMLEVSTTAKSSLFFSDNDSFSLTDGPGYLDAVRDLLGARFDRIHMAVVNRMSSLVG